MVDEGLTRVYVGSVVFVEVGGCVVGLGDVCVGCRCCGEGVVGVEGMGVVCSVVGLLYEHVGE